MNMICYTFAVNIFIFRQAAEMYSKIQEVGYSMIDESALFTYFYINATNQREHSQPPS